MPVNATYSTTALPYSVSQLAAALELSPSTVGRYRRLGCPHVLDPTHANRASFDLEAVQDWRVRTGKMGRGGGKSATDPTPLNQRGRGSAERDRAQRKLDSGEVADAFDTQTKLREATLRAKELEVVKRERIERVALGELCERDEIDRRLLARTQLVGAGLLSLGPRIAPKLAGKTVKQIERALVKAAQELLSEFAEAWPA